MLKWLFGRSKLVSNRAELVHFLAGEAAFISQKCTFEYCRARSGLNWDKLFKEEAFAEAVDASRWRGFVAVLSDVVLVAEGRLRAPAENGGDPLVQSLASVAGEALAHFPEARGRKDIDWAAEVHEIRERLARAQLAPPKPAHEIALRSGSIVFDSLPVHPSIRAYDRELVTNNIRFNLARTATTMDERFDPALATDLLAPAK